VSAFPNLRLHVIARNTLVAEVLVEETRAIVEQAGRVRGDSVETPAARGSVGHRPLKSNQRREPERPVVRAMLEEMIVEPIMVPIATVLTKSKILAVPTVVLPARRSNRMA
jgi:hypothetical protein